MNEIFRCPQCRRPLSSRRRDEPHKKPDDTRCVFVLTFDVHYLIEDIYEGDYPRDDTRQFIDDTLPDRWDVEDGMSLSIKTARLLEDKGNTETWGNWFSNPDGSYTVNYGTGEECESSSHLYGYTTWEINQVVAHLSRPRVAA